MHMQILFISCMLNNSFIRKKMIITQPPFHNRLLPIYSMDHFLWLDINWHNKKRQ